MSKTKDKTGQLQAAEASRSGQSGSPDMKIAVQYFRSSREVVKDGEPLLPGRFSESERAELVESAVDRFGSIILILTETELPPEEVTSFTLEAKFPDPEAPTGELIDYIAETKQSRAIHAASADGLRRWNDTGTPPPEPIDANIPGVAGRPSKRNGTGWKVLPASVRHLQPRIKISHNVRVKQNPETLKERPIDEDPWKGAAIERTSEIAGRHLSMDELEQRIIADIATLKLGDPTRAKRVAEQVTRIAEVQVESKIMSKKPKNEGDSQVEPFSPDHTLQSKESNEDPRYVRNLGLREAARLISKIRSINLGSTQLKRYFLEKDLKIGAKGPRGEPLFSRFECETFVPPNRPRGRPKKNSELPP